LFCERSYRVLNCAVTKKHFFRISKLHYHCQKVIMKIWIMVKIWCKLEWAKDGQEMTRWIHKYYHTFSLICVLVQTESKITENVWRFLFIQLLIFQQIFARFLSNFHRNLYFWKFFLNIMTRFKKSLKKPHQFGTPMYVYIIW